MRKREKECCIYDKRQSVYDKTDFRSKFYNGNWAYAWIDTCYEQAYGSGKNVYDVMWEKVSDKKEHLPAKLYKFFPFNANSLKCIEENKVYLNTPSRFNDPFDCRICASEMEFVKKYLIEHIKSTEAITRGVLTEREYIEILDSVCYIPHYMSTKRTFDSALNRIICWDGKYNRMAEELLSVCRVAREKYLSVIKEIRDQNIRVCCFSDMGDEYIKVATEMWGHYTQSHYGFCVEYDIKGYADSEEYKIPLGLLLPCVYSSKGIKIGKEYIYKIATNKKMTSFQQKAFEKSIMKSFLIKSSSWSYEKEWRLIVPQEICDYYSNMIPFFPVSRIYLGCNMERDNKEYMYKLAKRKGFKICDMTVSDDLFSLEEKNINVDEYFIEKDYYKQREINGLQYETLKRDLFNHEYLTRKF